MFCRKCGTQFEGKFCPNCGEPSQLENSHPVQSNIPERNITKTDNALVSMIFGVVSIIVSITCLGFIPAIVALILGKQCIKKDTGNPVQAKAGIIMGWISIGITVFLVLLVFFAALADM